MVNMQSANKTKLYSLIKKDLKAYDGKIILLKGEYCGGSDRCYGMFEFNVRDNPILRVAVGNKSQEKWFGILIHEYCHFLQWKESSQIWKDFEETDVNIDLIIKSPKKYKKEILLLLRLEADCERRVVKLIKQYNLFDESEYIKEANAVLYKYGFLYTNGFWPSSSKNGGLKDIEKLCPTKIHKSYYKYLETPNDIYDIYINLRA
jgi:hypothetical protein